MGRELRHVKVTFTVRRSEQLPAMDDGEPMYADDVAGEVQEVVQVALDAWYAERGRLLLACEPDAM